MSFIDLITPRLRIRDHYMSDLSTHHSLMSDDLIMYYLQDIKTDSLEASRENLVSSIDAIDDPHRALYFFRIETLDTMEHVGEIGYDVTRFDSEGKIVHLGYFTNQKFWNKGFVTEALMKLLEFSFTENNVSLITTGCLEENKGSERVMLKCGMVRDQDRDHFEVHEGIPKKYIAYYITKEEWQQKSINNLK